MQKCYSCQDKVTEILLFLGDVPPPPLSSRLEGCVPVPHPPAFDAHASNSVYFRSVLPKGCMYYKGTLTQSRYSLSLSS